MKQSSTRSTLLPQARVALTTGFLAALLALPLAVRAQSAPTAPDASAQAPDAAAAQTAPAAAQTTPAAAQTTPAVAVSNQKAAKARKQTEKVIASKDTKKEDEKDRKNQKDQILAKMDVKLPDKQLYDKAQDAIKHGRYDVGRIDLQTLLNTYPDSPYMLQAKLSIADAWYKEGGSAALTQAEQEYKDFITFFPNAPEAAEAQMRVGDIYFRQMDKPDRDYTKTQQAEVEYRLMLQQFPDSPLVPQARGRLREVQEVLASRESSIADYYATHLNWSAVIARYQTVVDTYPLYSHMDDALIGIGDAYEAMAHAIRIQRNNIPEYARAHLEKVYDDQAYAAYSKVVLEHAASQHVEDAKDRISALNRPIPTPTAEQVAASVALENSRGQYTLSKRATLLFMHQADTVQAATTGNPPLVDAKPTVAHDIINDWNRNMQEAFNPATASSPSAATSAPAAGPVAPVATATADANPPASTAPLALENVPTATSSDSRSSSVSSVAAMPTSSATSSGAGVGIQIIQSAPGSQTQATPGNTAFPGTSGSAPVANPAQSASTTAQPAAAAPAQPGARPEPVIAPVGPPTNTVLAPVEHADQPVDAINEIKPGTQPAAQAPTAGAKKPKADCDTALESCSKKKPKKGLKKLNPF